MLSSERRPLCALTLCIVGQLDASKFRSFREINCTFGRFGAEAFDWQYFESPPKDGDHAELDHLNIENGS